MCWENILLYKAKTINPGKGENTIVEHNNIKLRVSFTKLERCADNFASY
jgi:hypothetical protein